MTIEAKVTKQRDDQWLASVVIGEREQVLGCFSTEGLATHAATGAARKARAS